MAESERRQVDHMESRAQLDAEQQRNEGMQGRLDATAGELDRIKQDVQACCSSLVRPCPAAAV